MTEGACPRAQGLVRLAKAAQGLAGLATAALPIDPGRVSRTPSTLFAVCNTARHSMTLLYISIHMCDICCRTHVDDVVRRAHVWFDHRAALQPRRRVGRLLPSSVAAVGVARFAMGLISILRFFGVLSLSL